MLVSLDLQIDNSCQWSESTTENNVMECSGGTKCNVITGGWSCCGEQGLKRLKCPLNIPIMCWANTCGYNQSEYCCAPSKVACDTLYTGVRDCQGSYFELFHISKEE